MKKVSYAFAFLLCIAWVSSCTTKEVDNNKSGSDIKVRIASEPDEPYKVIEVFPVLEDTLKYRITFYKNGNIGAILQHGPSGLDGLVVGFFMNGKVSKFGNVVNGKPVGVWHYFKPKDGSLSSIDTFKIE